MALPEPPTNIPRIVEVQDPGTGHYVVMVRMPTQLAAKFPDKPWGTEIDTIGLAKQDSDRFPGYTLVDVEPLKGSPDLYWIFQKLDGPVWTTKSLGQDSLVPAKFRRLVTTTRSKQEVTPDTEPSAIEGDLTASVVQQQDDTGKAVKVDTAEEIDVDGSPLLGKQMIEYGIADTSESLVEEGAALPAIDYYTLSLSQDPLGNGKSVLSTTSIDEFPILEGTEILAPFNIPVQILKQVVPARTEGSASGNTIVEVRPIDKWRSIQITSVIGFGSLPVPETFPKDVRYKFPDVLLKVQHVILMSTYNLFWKGHDDVLLNIKEGPSGSFKGRVVRSFHFGPPPNTATLWNPIPKSDTVAWINRVNASGFWNEVYRGSKSIPATLHKTITVQSVVDLPNNGDLRPVHGLNARFASTGIDLMQPTNITDLPPSGTELLIDRNSERIRGDVWVMEQTYLTVP